MPCIVVKPGLGFDYFRVTQHKNLAVRGTLNKFVCWLQRFCSHKQFASKIAGLFCFALSVPSLPLH